MAKRVFVSGGNAGIGFALCKQLATEDGCHVYLGSRNQAKGEAAVGAIKQAAPSAAVELVTVDVSSDESVASAAVALTAALGSEKLYAIVNNAGTGLAHNVDTRTTVNTNLYGPKRVVEAFLPLLQEGGRVVNVGSGAGPSFIRGCSSMDVKKTLCSPDASWEQIEAALTAGISLDGMAGYGVSKAALSAYTMLLARLHPGVVCSCVSPGYIKTAIVGHRASKPPEEGTVSIRHCLFQELAGSGYYYGSDGVRSPLHFMRNPGEPAYDGKPPF